MKRIFLFAAVIGAVLLGSSVPSEAYYYRRYYGPVFVRPRFRPLLVAPPVVVVRPAPVIVPPVVVVRPAPVVVVPY